jgi:predicted ATPase
MELSGKNVSYLFVRNVLRLPSITISARSYAMTLKSRAAHADEKLVEPDISLGPLLGEDDFEDQENNHDALSSLPCDYRATDSGLCDDIPCPANNAVPCKEWEYDLHGKLSARDEEARQIQEACQRSLLNRTNELVWIEGPDGVGKTTLARHVGCGLHDIGGAALFLEGRCDRLQRNWPYTAYVEALRSWSLLALTDHEQAMAIRERMLCEMEEKELLLLGSLVPELNALFSPTYAIEGEVSNCDKMKAFKRFRFLFRVFLRSIAAYTQLAVLFLDDFHKADEALVELFQSLLLETKGHGITFIIAYKDDSLCRNKSQVYFRNVSSFRSDKVTLTHIKLDSLGAPEIQSMLRDVLRLEEQECQALGSFVFGQTKGNVFRIHELLEALKQEKFLRIHSAASSWCWDMDEINLEFGDVQNRIQSKAELLSEETLRILKAAACLGAKMDDELLIHLMEGKVFWRRVSKAFWSTRKGKERSSLRMTLSKRQFMA